MANHLVDYLIHLLKKIGTVLSEFLIQIRKKGKRLKQLDVKFVNLLGKRLEKKLKNFYYGGGDPKFRIVMSIMRWVDSKINNNLDSNSE